MIASGLVARVRESSYTDKKTGGIVPMLYVDLVDEGVGVLMLSARKEKISAVPMVGQKVSANVVAVRAGQYGINYTVDGFAFDKPAPPKGA